MQTACNALMFTSFGANIIFMIVFLIKLPYRLSVIHANGNHLEEKESAPLLRKKYLANILKLLIVNIISLLVSAITCLLDGLSDTENGLMIPTWVFLSINLLSVLFFAVYCTILRTKYNLITSSIGYNWRTNSPVDLLMCIFIAFIFAFNSALNALSAFCLR